MHTIYLFIPEKYLYYIIYYRQDKPADFRKHHRSFCVLIKICICSVHFGGLTAPAEQQFLAGA